MAPAAEWTGYAPTSGSPAPLRYELSFPGEETDREGFVLWRYNATLEDGSRPAQALETHPTWVNNGAIQGIYYDLDYITFQEGDRFAAQVGFLEGAEAGKVTFSIAWFDISDDVSHWETIASLPAEYDGVVQDWVVLLPDKLIGKEGYFSLKVDAGSSSAQDWAVWVEARLERP